MTCGYEAVARRDKGGLARPWQAFARRMQRRAFAFATYTWSKHAQTHIRPDARAVRGKREDWRSAQTNNQISYELIIGDHTELRPQSCVGVHWVAAQYDPTSSYYQTHQTKDNTKENNKLAPSTSNK